MGEVGEGVISKGIDERFQRAKFGLVNGGSGVIEGDRQAVSTCEIRVGERG